MDLLLHCQLLRSCPSRPHAEHLGSQRPHRHRRRPQSPRRSRVQSLQAAALKQPCTRLQPADNAPTPSEDPPPPPPPLEDSQPEAMSSAGITSAVPKTVAPKATVLAPSPGSGFICACSAQEADESSQQAPAAVAAAAAGGASGRCHCAGHQSVPPQCGHAAPLWGLSMPCRPGFVRTRCPSSACGFEAGIVFLIEEVIRLLRSF